MDAENLLNNLLNDEFQIEVLKEVLDEITPEFINEVNHKLYNDMNRKLSGMTNESIHKPPTSSQSKYLYVMKYVITESQYNRLLSEDETKARQYVRRRLSNIEELIDKHMEEDDPNDWDDEFEYASNIINMTISDLSDFDYDTMDEDDVIDVIKEYFAETILDHYYDNVSPDDDEDEEDDF